MTTAVVTDSGASLPAGLADELGIRVVPLKVTLDGRTGDETLDISAADVTRALRARKSVTTSRPTPAEFARVFRSAFDSGAESVVSVHISSQLSGTWDSARLAAAEFGAGTVRVVDSFGAGMGQGYAVLAAARAAAGGASVSEVHEAAARVVRNTETFFYVDSVEYLRRGGRIGPTAALLATSLAIKPILGLSGGTVVPLEKVRTASKAIARMVRLTAEAARGQVDLAVHHVAAPERAREIAQQLRDSVPGAGEVLVSELGAALAAHLGPGALAAVVVRR